MVTTLLTRKPRARARPHPPDGAVEAPAGWFRTDIEGLRAVAVLLVVFFHARVPGFAGGFIGVDVFYVISGFLITRLLLDEFARATTISLRAFYARRIRRLLPAAGLVLAVTLVGSWFLLPPIDVPQTTGDVAASALYGANYRFAVQATDYLNAEAAPSPVLHYWSLAVEEQFYLLWPALLLLTLKARPRARWLLVAAAGASFGAALWLTDANQPWAFFSLPTRAWQLLAGAGLAFGIAWLRRIPPPVAAAAGWSGLGMLGIATVTFGTQTPYPGTAALLPVIGASLVLAAGSAQRQPTGGIGPLLAARPMQTIGKTSYSLYLWHWPALTLAAAWAGRDLTAFERAAAVAVAVAATALTFRLLENPLRHAPALAVPRKAIALGVALPLLITVLAVTVGQAGITRLRAPASPAAAGGEALPANLEPPLARARDDKPRPYVDGCHLDFDQIIPGRCAYGDPSSSTTIVLWGDSHAAQWFPAFEQLARTRGWRLVSMTKSACPAALVVPWQTAFKRVYSECPAWHDAVLDRIARERPTLVVGASSANYVLADARKAGTPEFDELWRRGLGAAVDRVREHAGHMVVLGDTPRFPTDVPSCLSKNVTAIDNCAIPLEDALGRNLGLERAVARAHGAAFLDPSSWLCPRDPCVPVQGRLLVYRDRHHMTTVFSRGLAPRLGEAFDELLA